MSSGYTTETPPPVRAPAGVPVITGSALAAECGHRSMSYRRGQPCLGCGLEIAYALRVPADLSTEATSPVMQPVER